jgi:hypothetical protein
MTIRDQRGDAAGREGDTTLAGARFSEESNLHDAEG